MLLYQITAEPIGERVDAFTVRCRTTKLGRWLGFQDWTLRAVDMNRHGRPLGGKCWCFETGEHVDSESFHAIEVAYWKIEGPKHDEAQRQRVLKALGESGREAVEGDCRCHRCIREHNLTWNGMRLDSAMMILCPKCGNKRCPHASDHDLACTNSNESGQPGSIFPKH